MYIFRFFPKKKEKLFIYLALAKPALPGQFVLFVSSQSKENASNVFVCSDAQHEIKIVVSEQHEKYFIICEQHKFLIFVSFIAEIG